MGLGDLETSLDQRFSDVMVGDRAEQTAVHASLLADGDGVAAQLLAHGLSSGQLFSGQTLQLGATCFEFLDRDFSGTTSALGRDQEVTGVAVLDLDNITEVAEVGHFFQQNDLHGWLLVRPCVDRSTAASPSSANA